MSFAIAAAEQSRRRYFLDLLRYNPDQGAYIQTALLGNRDPHDYITDNEFDSWSSIIKRGVINIEDVTKTHGVTIDPRYLEKVLPSASSGTMGVLMQAKKKIILSRDARCYFPLMRTTVAHELGHYVLHVQHESNKNGAEKEREANLFMSHILLPERLLGYGIQFACAFNRLDSGIAIVDANSERGRFVWKNTIFPILVNQLEVTRSLLIVRLQANRIFDSSTAEYHKSYTRRNRWMESVGEDQYFARQMVPVQAASRKYNSLQIA